jgi:hypothetical protein
MAQACCGWGIGYCATGARCDALSPRLSPAAGMVGTEAFATKRPLPGRWACKPSGVRQATGSPQGLPVVQAHPMCRPPLQLKSAPVVKPESSPASQATIDPISSGVPRRFTGMVATIFSRISGLMARTMSVPM